MARQVQFRRGTTSQNSAFTGAEGEIVVDTEQHKIILHDGVTVGGHPIATESFVASQIENASTIQSYADRNVTMPPTSTLGQAGDHYGHVAFDVNYLYFCTADYDGISAIWNRFPIAGATW
jgi:hypothetical protein